MAVAPPARGPFLIRSASGELRVADRAALQQALQERFAGMVVQVTDLPTGQRQTMQASGPDAADDDASALPLASTIAQQQNGGLFLGSSSGLEVAPPPEPASAETSPVQPGPATPPAPAVRKSGVMYRTPQRLAGRPAAQRRSAAPWIGAAAGAGAAALLAFAVIAVHGHGDPPARRPAVQDGMTPAVSASSTPAPPAAVAAPPAATADGAPNGRYFHCTGSEYLEPAGSAALDPPQFTVECWLRVDAVPEAVRGETRRWLVNKNVHEWQAGHWGLFIDRDRLGAYLNILGGAEHVICARSQPGAIKAREWQHLAMTYDGATLAVYLDGTIAGSVAAPGPRRPGTTPIAIGRRQDGHVSLVGDLDEVRLYDRALPEERIRLHRFHPDLVDREGLLGSWGFEGP